MATVNLSVNVGESKIITFHSGGTYNTEDIVFDVSANGGSTTIAAGASGDTNQLTLSASTKYKLTSAGSTFVFTTPPDHTYNFSGVSFTSTNSTASDKNANNLIGNGTYYYSTNGPATSLGAAADGGLYVQSYNSSWVGQIAQDYRNGRLFVRGKNNGTWSDWKRVANYDEIATSGHTHDTSIAKSNEDSQITLAFGTKYSIFAGGTSYVFTMPKNPNTDTTYTFATGDSNGQIKVTPSGGSAQNVSVKGLGSAAYTDSSAYAPVGHFHTEYAAERHTHATSIATSTGTNQITLAFGTKYSISTGGTSYVFTMPSLPTATSSVAGIATLGASGGSATYDHTHGSITNDGAITANTTIENGDHLVITDTSDSNKIKRTSITFGASQSTYLRNDGKWETPYTPLPSSLFDNNTPGIVIPIATTTNDITFEGDPTSYNRPPSLIFPSDSSSFALPIFMDKSGHLFMLISDIFAKELISTYGYTKTPSGK